MWATGREWLGRGAIDKDPKLEPDRWRARAFALAGDHSWMAR
jgi:hypothetical protein